MSDQNTAVPSRRIQRRAEQPPRGDERERAILAVARAALKAGRFDSVSITELAASAQVSRPNFYFYFASKDALLATLIEQVLAEIFSNLELAISREGSDVRARVREGVGHVVAA
ncbi:TetR/AcrR family transcriptional regulator [Massilia sp. YIM B02763]|uniref:TetR/AcrR family transcriptional regulator n=1 Tax=Massilia sp. YIM B02763 TaxID=3050130 RepID=UPI0025B6DBFD|nr:TetR/AcrR family transcriptional regulator [Massilia sp. YIM B02763]MDN4056523.1 TetR/AcrR family transcriptional regulator [Massilia sp. YIM B02763]